MKSHPKAGQIKLRGKRAKTLRCGCCDVFDHRPAYFKRLARAEAKKAGSMFEGAGIVVLKWPKL